MMERVPSSTVLEESTALDVQGRTAIQPIRESERMITHLSGQMAEMSSHLKAAVQRSRLSSAEHAMARERSSRER